MDRESVCSVRLSWLLDKVIGTEEEIKMRRKLDFMNYYALSVSPRYKILYSGSRGEGLEFESSDFDLMYVSKNTVVLNSLREKESIDSNDNKMLLLMHREGCRPGFVFLQFLPRSGIVDELVVNSMVKHLDMIVISSFVAKNEWTLRCRTVLPHVKNEPHGPCGTSKIGSSEIDHALCFTCCTWPSEAYNFIHRRRANGWPSKVLIDKIVEKGCHVVAIGDPNSNISYIQWRLSFSVAEKLLVHSFNHTQLKVYGLLKIFLKQVINTEESVRDLLCSYFLKTALFYSIETTPQSIWTEDLLISCFWFCFNKLITWVEQGNCPNYFVPENNMFRGKVYGERRQNLLRVLNGYKRLGWTCLCQCRDLKPLQAIVRRPEIGVEYQLINGLEYEALQDSEIFKKLFSQHIFTGKGRGMAKIMTMLTYSQSRDEESIASFKACCAFKSLVKMYTSKFKTGNDVPCNKSSYQLMRKCKWLLSISTILDLSRRYLTDATFYYTVGNYRKCLQICQQMLLRWSPGVAVVYTGTKIATMPNAYKQLVCGRGLSISDKVAKAWACDVFIEEEVKAFFPKELHRDVQEEPVALLIPPLPYTTFLMFLCHHNLGNIDSSLSALHDLRTLVYDKDQGGMRSYIVFNLLALCLQKIGDVSGAVEACVMSLRRKPKRNGASKLLEELIRKARR